MDSARLDRMITIRGKSQAQDDSGEPTNTWSIVALRRPASMAPLLGSEGFRDPQIVATQKVEFWIRYSADVAAVQPAVNDVVYPAMEGAEIPDNVPENRIYDILAVHEIGRRQGLKIVAERRPDVAT